MTEKYMQKAAFQLMQSYTTSTYISGVFLHDQHSMTSGHELLEDCREVFWHLFER